jgi:hypothetical protein
LAIYVEKQINHCTMKSIQKYLPNPRHVEVMRIFVAAKPDKAWHAARHFDMSETPWVRLLFHLRTITDRFHKRGKEVAGLGVDQITESGKGSIILYEDSGREVVVGSIGQFWHLTIPFKEIKPEEFASFHTPGWGKLAWAISVEPYFTGSTICVELRITATDKGSWHKLQNYYSVIGKGSKLIRHSVLNYLKAELGKLRFPDDDRRLLPGDEILPDIKFSSTDHIDIEAPPSIVWRYLMQMGCDRAGWYSIDWLDNAGKRSVNHLVDGWTDRKVGDRLAATPNKESHFNVLQVEHEKYFVMGAKAEKVGIMHPFQMTWAFVLEPLGTDATHLLARARMRAAPKWAEWLMGEVVYPPVHGLMSMVQLKTIRRYAERDALKQPELAVYTE